MIIWWRPETRAQRIRRAGGRRYVTTLVWRWTPIGSIGWGV